MKTSNVAYEPRDVNARALSVVGIVILVLAIVVNFAVLLTFNRFVAMDRQDELQPSTLVRPGDMTTPPAPRLEVDPADALRQLRSGEADELNGYAWIDRKTGIIRIPIDQAMKVLVERGLP